MKLKSLFSKLKRSINNDKANEIPIESEFNKLNISDRNSNQSIKIVHIDLLNNYVVKNVILAV